MLEKLVLEIHLPTIPPGINQTYGISKKRTKKGELKPTLYKHTEVIEWERGAALIIGSQAALQDFEDTSEYYSIYICFDQKRHDVDAFVKLTIDVLATKLGFNDSRILKQTSEKIIDWNKEGLLIRLYQYGGNSGG